jgi:hypothetical protein
VAIYLFSYGISDIYDGSFQLFFLDISTIIEFQTESEFMKLLVASYFFTMYIILVFNAVTTTIM